MNYIDVKEAAKATGKSEKTIRRFLYKSESKPFVCKKDTKLLVDVNYLFDSYPPIKVDKNEGGQMVDSGLDMSMDIELYELKNKLALYEQQIRHKDQLLAEKEGRIMDLQKAILLLEAPKEKELLTANKKPWWKFFITL